MNLDLILTLVFFGLLLLFFFSHRSKFTVQGKIFAMYKTKLGIALMDKIAKTAPRTLYVIGIIGVIIGFLGMGYIVYYLVRSTYTLIFVPKALPAIAPVLPGIRVIPGLPTLGFLHWIIAIFLVAVVHEFSHGIYSRLSNTPIKSSGFAFLGPILAAFVEPDEKILAKKTKIQQLSVMAAGAFSNIVFAIIAFLILNFFTGPVLAQVIEPAGIQINKIVEDFPVAHAGLEAPFVIQGINNAEIKNFTDFLSATAKLKPGDKITLKTNKGVHEITLAANPENSSRGYLGVTDFTTHTKPKDSIVANYGTMLPNFFSWFHMLFFWLFVINLGVGLFNLLPLGPIDGGRMFLIGIAAIWKDENTIKRIFTLVTLFLFLLLFINLLPYLYKLLLFLAKPLIALGP